jgi:hypothetical protein
MNGAQVLSETLAANMGLGGPDAAAQAPGRSLGCAARRVETAEAFHAMLPDCNGEPGPSLIEVRL